MQISEEYRKSLDFWQEAFVLSKEGKEAYLQKMKQAETLPELAPSMKLYQAVLTLSEKEKILDYGCGHGWASLILAKSGAKDITAVEVTESAAKALKELSKEASLDDVLHVQHVTTSWIHEVPAASFDGLVCSNVLDIVPREVCEDILSQMARIVKQDADIVIGMNYYMEPKENPERHLTIDKGNHIYIDGILRMVSRRDEEWKEIFEKYFEVTQVQHFAWPKETEERRRIFLMKKKSPAEAK